MRGTATVGALATVVTAGLSAREACIITVSGAKLEFCLGSPLSLGGSLKLLGGMFHLSVLRDDPRLKGINFSLVRSVDPSHLLLNFTGPVSSVSSFSLKRSVSLVALSNSVCRSGFEVADLRS